MICATVCVGSDDIYQWVQIFIDDASHYGLSPNRPRVWKVPSKLMEQVVDQLNRNQP